MKREERSTVASGKGFRQNRAYLLCFWEARRRRIEKAKSKGKGGKAAADEGISGRRKSLRFFWQRRLSSGEGAARGGRKKWR